MSKGVEIVVLAAATAVGRRGRSRMRTVGRCTRTYSPTHVRARAHTHTHTHTHTHKALLTVRRPTPFLSRPRLRVDVTVLELGSIQISQILSQTISSNPFLHARLQALSSAKDEIHFAIQVLLLLLRWLQSLLSSLQSTSCSASTSRDFQKCKLRTTNSACDGRVLEHQASFVC